MIGEEYQEELGALKKELKCWENMFQRKHGRKPSKDDVETAAPEVKETYVKYRELKQVATGKSGGKRRSTESTGSASNTTGGTVAHDQECDIKETTSSTAVEDVEKDEVFGKDLNKKVLKPAPVVEKKPKIWSLGKITLKHGQRPKRTNTLSSSQNEEKTDQDLLQKDEAYDENTATNVQSDDFNLGFSIISKSKDTSRSSPMPANFISPGVGNLKKTKQECLIRMKRRASLIKALVDEEAINVQENDFDQGVSFEQKSSVPTSLETLEFVDKSVNKSDKKVEIHETKGIKKPSQIQTLSSWESEIAEEFLNETNTNKTGPCKTQDSISCDGVASNKTICEIEESINVTKSSQRKVSRTKILQSDDEDENEPNLGIDKTKASKIVDSVSSSGTQQCSSTQRNSSALENITSGVNAGSSDVVKDASLSNVQETYSNGLENRRKRSNHSIEKVAIQSSSKSNFHEMERQDSFVELSSPSYSSNKTSTNKMESRSVISDINDSEKTGKSETVFEEWIPNEVDDGVEDLKDIWKKRKREEEDELEYKRIKRNKLSEEREMNSSINGFKDIDVEVKINKKKKKGRLEDDKDIDMTPEMTEAISKGGGGGSRRSSSLVSDNFVRLNMKRKTYKRRGGGVSGSTFKRRNWKDIMKSKGEHVQGGGGGWWRGGKQGSNCFKCGDTGHWAKNCRGKRKAPSNTDASSTCLDEEADVLDNGPMNLQADEDFPTINEAAMMAAGIPITPQASQDYSYNTGNLSMDITNTPLPHQLPRPTYIPVAPPSAIEPLFQAIDGKPADTPDEVYSVLKNFGFNSFREGQEAAIMRILSGLSTLVVLSTGAGKSLCYQLPAYMYYRQSSSLTLVISPLVSLMEDQVAGMPFGLRGACLHNNMSKQQRQKVVSDLCDGKIAVLLLSPEALVGGGGGGGCLPPPSRLPSIAFACIDEAHCLSEWSHNFRPSYLRVCKVLRQKLGVTCFLGLTATATKVTATSVAEHIGIASLDNVIRGGAVPPNLQLSVSCDSDRDKAIVELLHAPRFAVCDSIIIYCTRREQTEKLSSLLRTSLQHFPPPVPKEEPAVSDQEEENEETVKGKGKGRGKGKTKKKPKPKPKKAKKTTPLWSSECYHAGMTPAARRKVQKQFMSGQLHIVVATVAFGMGLDKSDVRGIIHYNMPKSFESYVQEIGRAGRDGKPAQCHVFLDPDGKDSWELKRHIFGNTVDRSSIKILVRQAFPICKCKDLHKDQIKRRSLNREDAEGLNCTIEEMNGCDEEIDSMLQAIDDLDCVMHCENGADEEKLVVHEEEGKSLDCSSVAGMEINEENHTDVIQNTEKESELAAPNKDEIMQLQLEESKDGLDNQSTIAENTSEEDTEMCTPTKADNSLPPKLSPYLVDDAEPLERYCGGHEVALPIDRLVDDLDMREENIATLLCYLELHPKHWVEVLQPCRATCTIKCYGGLKQLKAVARRVPPVAAAIAYIQKEGTDVKTGIISFPVITVADNMGWDLEPVVRELRGLQWNSSMNLDTDQAQAGNSGLIVEFTDIATHFRAVGDLTDKEYDQICDFLEDRIQAEEKSQVFQLKLLSSALKGVAHRQYWFCSEEVDTKSDKKLKQIIHTYFEDSKDYTQQELMNMTKARKKGNSFEDSPEDDNDKDVNWDAVGRDIRGLVSLNCDTGFTGRAVARVFHGIESPCYPAIVWGRDRRYWRKYLDVDFNKLRKFATRVLIECR